MAEETTGFRFLVRGYHGTSFANAQLICSAGFDPSLGSGLLGPGTYFFEENVAAAQRWAELHHRETPAVVVAQLDLTTNGLDLTQRAGREALIEFVAEFADVDELLRLAGTPDSSEVPLLEEVVLLLLDRVSEQPIRWVRVLVLDRVQSYSRFGTGVKLLSLPERLATAGLTTRIVRNIQTHVVVRDPCVVTQATMSQP